MGKFYILTDIFIELIINKLYLIAINLLDQPIIFQKLSFSFLKNLNT